ncbi:MAG TPA: siroheme synthase CysG [Xanthobacteraceae bacterium]|nr:siroheme synthase CysG [Xanthobacteraceae bacterium]
MTEPRIPTEAKPPRMEPLSRLPLFFALDGKRALVAGTNAGAVWKAELLSATGALVQVFAAEPSEELLALAGDPPNGAITIHRRTWMDSDFAGCAIAIGACEDDEAARFAAAARNAGVPVNVIDKPKFCDFAFGAIVNRSPLVVGVSTDGSAPVFGQAIRAKLESILPAGYARWAQAAKGWRAKVQAAGLSFGGRRRFWHMFTARAIANAGRAPESSDFDELLARTRVEGESADRGSVILVGAGPGNPELLTLRAVRALQSADVILIDDLVAPEVLDFARREAKKMMVGKTARGPSCKQEEINALMISLAKSGKRVVRLKGGDPMIFGRAGEEIAACRTEGIPVEVVPGITAAQGAAGRLAVSLTHRREARRLQYVTGHAEDGKLPADFDWASIADPKATTVVYMPMRTIGEFARHAMENGLDPKTPAIAVSRATRPDEQVIVSTLGDLPDRLVAEAVAGPLLVLIGEVLADYDAASVGGMIVEAVREMRAAD